MRMFAFKFAPKSVLVKQNHSTDKLLFQLINCSKCTKTCPQPWLPLINDLVDDVFSCTQPRQTLTAAVRRQSEAEVNFCLENFTIHCG